MANKANSKKSVVSVPATRVPVQLNLPFHEATGIIPALSVLEYEALKADIKANGLKAPIVLAGKQVIDGRSRLRICRELKIAPRFQQSEVSNSAAATAEVLSFNFHRRQLTESQRAIIAARLTTTKRGANQHTAGAVSQGVAAKALGVSVDTLQRADFVLEHGVKKLSDAVQSGKLDSTNAKRVALYERPVQLDLLSGIDGDQFLQRLSENLQAHETAVARAEIVAEIEEARKRRKPLSKQDIAGYNVVYADPPWDYIGKKAPYDTMTLDDICRMQVKNGPESCVLFLWCSACNIKEAFQVIDAWGFELKTQAVWDKVKLGTGQYFRVDHENLFLATRGHPPVAKKARSSVIHEAKTKHSKKPLAAYELIEAMYPELPKIELFCRGTPRKGWAGWGDQCIKAEVAKAKSVNATSRKAA